ncbi:hypothetical protein [uncultured Herbaspirillum sp.]|nr:hypothetical protein [uncultured Herbaspirillum sp.]
MESTEIPAPSPAQTISPAPGRLRGKLDSTTIAATALAAGSQPV